MTENATCERRVLARATGYCVEHCSCGLIHVYAGPITMHMESESCEAFTTVLAKAMVVLSQLRREESKPSLRLVPDEGGGTSVMDGGVS